jgi:SAM-dependent methyltransferase
MKHPICPNCNHNETEEFFTIKNAPTQSLLTVKSRDEALKIRKDEINLSFCNNCGFIYNRTFDTSIDYYTQGYEDQQGFSPTFKEFITCISNRLIEKYDLHNKDIIEVGCGKGDFISLLCELGNNRGIGIDPAYVPGRVQPNPNLKFITEFYNTGHGNLPADIICCRHTLEHIHDTGNFLRTIRDSIGEKKDTIVFFEVPYIVRILKMEAFWDIFYEHCSYFSPGSLARLFRLNRFEVIDMYLEYGDQYLFIEARPVDEISEKIHPLEETVTDLKELTGNFATNVKRRLDQWRTDLKAMKEAGKKVVIWGGGSKSVGFLVNLNGVNAIDHVVDINPHMQGNYIPGIGIRYLGPDDLIHHNPDMVIIMNSVYMDEISEMLNSKGLYPELIGL